MDDNEQSSTDDNQPGNDQSSSNDNQSSTEDNQSSDNQSTNDQTNTEDSQSSDDDDDAACGNGDAENADQAATIQQAFIDEFTSASGSGEVANASFSEDAMSTSYSGHFTKLTSAQQTTAGSAFGTSLDTSGVYLSNFIGFKKRAFTIAFAAPAAISAVLGLPSIYIINCGSFDPPASTLIHELTHVWQSQHHRDPIQYIQNSLESQKLALTLNVSVGSVQSLYPFSPYAYIPGKAFNEYAAEQIAKQVEKGVASIVSHVSNVPLNARDPDNETSLAAARCENKKNAGVQW